MVCGYSNKLFQLRFSTTFYLIVTDINETATYKNTANHTSGDLIVPKVHKSTTNTEKQTKRKRKQTIFNLIVGENEHRSVCIFGLDVTDCQNMWKKNILWLRRNKKIYMTVKLQPCNYRSYKNNNFPYVIELNVILGLTENF